MDVQPSSTRYVNVVEDSDRWRHVELRPGDIIISTPPKSGTTWTQGMVWSLLWPNGDAPGTLSDMFIWPDARFMSRDDMGRLVAEVSHRRFMKSHSPATGLPWSDEVLYIATYRHPADALVSWGNHRADMAPEAMAFLNRNAVAEGVPPLPETWDGDYHTLYREWLDVCNPFNHLASWWPRRAEPNVLLLHYADLTVDLEAGMGRIADFLGLAVDEDLWTEVVERCTLRSMREAARPSSRPGVWKRGVESFYYKGGLGRGAELLPPDILTEIETTTHPDLSPSALLWLHEGGPVD